MPTPFSWRSHSDNNAEQELPFDLELEKRRVAAAFNLTGEWDKDITFQEFTSWRNNRFQWLVWPDGNMAFHLSERPGMDLRVRDNGEIMQYRARYSAPKMARGLFKLGISIEVLEREFGPLLSAHEKLACREEMPREFWPPSWLENEPI